MYDKEKMPKNMKDKQGKQKKELPKRGQRTATNKRNKK